jgi:hypothetical protein
MRSFMTQQMGWLVSASPPITVLPRPNALSFVGFQASLLLLQQNGKYKVVHIAASLPRLDIAPRIMYPERVRAISTWRFNLLAH